MSVGKKIAFAVAVNYIGKGLTILTKVFYTPILFRYLPKNELGLWLLVSDSSLLVNLLGMGVIPILTRNIALAKGKIDRENQEDITNKNQNNTIGDLTKTGQIVLYCLSVIIFFVMWTLGYFFLKDSSTQISYNTFIFALTMVCFSYSVGVAKSYLDCWLVGVGHVGWNSVAIIISNNLGVLLSIFALIKGGNVLHLAIILLGSKIVEYLLSLIIIYYKNDKNIFVIGEWNHELFTSLIKPSLAWWLTNLSVFLLLRTDSYFIAGFKGLGELPVYLATYQLIANVAELSISFALASATFIGQAWEAGNMTMVHNLTLRNANTALKIMALGTSFLIICGKEIIELWIGKDNFIGYPILIIFCITLTLETQAKSLTSSSRATNDEKYVVNTFLAALLNIILTWSLIKPLGLFGVALSTLIAQILTSNWYRVYRPLKRLNIRFSVYFQKVILPWFMMLGVSLLIGYIIKTSVILINDDLKIFYIIAIIFSYSMIFFFSKIANYLKKQQNKI